MSMRTCPLCKGQRQSIVFVNRGEDIRTHTQEVRDCDTCGGVGAMPAEQAWDLERRIAEGRKLREARQAAGMSIYQAAKAEGVLPAVVSARESPRR